MAILVREDYLKIIEEIRNLEKQALDNYIEKKLIPLKNENEFFVETLYKDILYVLRDVDQDGDNDLMIVDGDFVFEDDDYKLTGYQTRLHEITIWLHREVANKIIQSDPLHFVEKMEQFEKSVLDKTSYTVEYRNKLDAINRSIKVERSENYEKETSSDNKLTEEMIDGLTIDALAAIDRILADHRTLNSDRIELTRFARENKNWVNIQDSVLNDIYFYLTEKGFVTSNNPTDSVNKFLVAFTPEGRKLHKAGSLRKYYQKETSVEEKILEYLRPHVDSVRNSKIQTDLQLDEKECEDALRTLSALKYIHTEEMTGNDFMNGHYSVIADEGRTHLYHLKNPNHTKNAHHSITQIISGRNVFASAGANAKISGVNFDVVNTNYSQLKEWGVSENKIEELKTMVENNKTDKPSRISKVLKWVAGVGADLAAKELVDNIDKVTDFVTHLVK
jgi:hypothetical protein